MPYKGQDAERFVELIAGLAATFGKEADRPILIGYEMALEDVPLQDIARGVARAIRECEFMPTGAKLRELSGVVSLSTRAAIAWGCLKRAIGTHGAYASIEFDDTAITATIRNLGGWERICSVNSGDDFDKWLRQQFERVYCQFCRDGFSAEMAKPLIGICDRDNSANGFLKDVQLPALIETGLRPLPNLPAPERRRIAASPTALIPEMRGSEQ